MEARNRHLPEWFNRMSTGQIRLPRFQRYQAWGHSEVSDLLEAVLRGLPVGATLILEVGDREQFLSRTMEGAPEPSERATEQLLDGQQRLTALWRSFNDNYRDRTYFVYFESDEEHGGVEIPLVFGQARWSRNGNRYPLWADEPAEVAQRGYLPLRLLRPEDLGTEIEEWCDPAANGDLAESRRLERKIRGLRDLVTTYNVPFLSLPTTTPKDVAVNVFIKMNTTSVRLTPFDIVVAQVEEAAGESLHDLVAELRARVTEVDAYESAPELILSTAALREDRAPTQASYQRLDLHRLVGDWDSLTAGIGWVVQVLEEEGIFDGARLPTVAVLPVLGALHEVVPAALDARGNASTLIRKYLWRSFFTRRYENAASTGALQDYRAMRDALSAGEPDAKAPIFDESQYPLPTIEELKLAGWPKARDILARAVQAVALRAGAFDLADGSKVTRANLTLREYHHLFPSHLLTVDGGITPQDSSRALNCALITWNTNRNISAKEPLKYLRERAERSALGEEEIRGRLATHLIPYDELAVGGYEEMTDRVAAQTRIQEDYERFIAVRAELMLSAMRTLCDGRRWPEVRA